MAKVKKPGFSGAQCHTVIEKDQEIIIASGSFISLVKDISLLNNIIHCEKSIIMQKILVTKRLL